MIIDKVLENCSPAARASLEAEVRGATFVRIQDVVDYFWMHEQDNWNIDEDFPIIRPPWPKVWMEWRSPSVARIGDEIRHNIDQVDMGLFAEYVSEMVPPGCTKEDGVVGTLRLVYCSPYRGILGAQGLPLKADGGFAPIHPPGTPDGSLVMPFVLDPHLFPPPPGWRSGDPPTDEYKMVVNALEVSYRIPALLALSFCHCKNLRPREEPVPPALQKARRRRGRVPVERYYVLDIGPMKAVIEQAKREGNVTDLRSALHMVRGHFKTYTEDAPLFGSKTGTYWWGMHARGDAAAGTIKKDYEVAPR